MQDDNVFFYVVPTDKFNLAGSAVRLPKNSTWYRDARGGVESEPTIASRDPTPAPGETDANATERPFLDATEHLAITFPELEKLGREGTLPLKSVEAGVVFGTDPRTCHVVLGYRGTSGISSKQFAIRTDNRQRVVLVDMGSSHGTAVETDGQNKEQKRSWDQWILSGQPGSENRFNNINVWLGELALNVIFPNHHRASPPYIQRLTDFGQAWGVPESRTNEEAFALSALELQSHLSTQAPTGAHTPSSTPVYYRDKRIGQGAFGQVYRVIKMSDGQYYAAKTFASKDKKRERNSKDPRWLTNIRREFTLVHENPHPNVVRMFGFVDSLEPAIIMEYFRAGNIADLGPLDEITYISAFGQILSGLEHLHKKGIAHRDLKPENFLVESHPVFRVAISDFGLAKTVPTSALLSTFCGSLMYVAPEVFPHIKGHDHKVDIWSLGVIVLEWIYNIPKPPKLPHGRPISHIQPSFWRSWVDSWSRNLHATLYDQEDCVLLKMLSTMLEIDTGIRWEAKQLLEYGLDSNLFRRRKVDGLVECVDDPSDSSEDVKRASGSATPRASSPENKQPTTATDKALSPVHEEDLEPTVIIDRLWTV